jgi:hypothetical protein
LDEPSVSFGEGPQEAENVVGTNRLPFVAETQILNGDPNGRGQQQIGSKCVLTEELANALGRLPQLDHHIAEVLAGAKQLEGTPRNFAGVVPAISPLCRVAFDFLIVEVDESTTAYRVQVDAFQASNGCFREAKAFGHLFAGELSAI